jgi:diadenosine tetraphosphatase ApaH/serine/threonine PP2A family protein phosphatase
MDLDKCLEVIRSGNQLSESDTTEIFTLLKDILYQECTIHPLSLPVTICGDIHGQLYDLFELFRISGGPEQNRYVFLGDYVDRGYYSLATFLFLAILKLKHPDRIYLLRGNHECRQVNQIYGFYDECLSLCGHTGLWRACNDVFDLLPIGALIANRIFCIHGGLCPSIALIEEIPLLDRQQELPTNGPLSDLTWGDPEDIECWGVSQRGAGWLFGRRPTSEFCHNNELSLIARAHQMAMAGYQWHFDGEQLVTVWSAPNYMYRSGNAACVLKIGEDFGREFVVFHAVPDDQRVFPKERTPFYFT